MLMGRWSWGIKYLPALVGHAEHPGLERILLVLPLFILFSIQLARLEEWASKSDMMLKKIEARPCCWDNAPKEPSTARDLCGWELPCWKRRGGPGVPQLNSSQQRSWDANCTMGCIYQSFISRDRDVIYLSHTTQHLTDHTCSTMSRSGPSNLEKINK